MLRIVSTPLALAAAVALLAPAAARAQETDEQLWLQTNAKVALGEDTELTLEGIARFSDREDGLFHTEIGGIISHEFSEHVEVGFGYRRLGIHADDSADREDRLRQQIVFTFGRITSRLRVDERFHPDGDEVGVRIRPFVRYNHPIGKDTTLFLSHESFILANSTDWGQRAGYDRIRNIIGVAVPIAQGVSSDIGYLNQYRFARDGNRAQMDHILSVQLSLSL